MTDRQHCTAKSKQTGKRCKNWPAPGATVCRFHGGRAGQVQAAARVRLIAAEAGEQLARLGVTIETTPVESLEAMLFEAAGNVAVLRQMVGELDAKPAGDDDRNGTSAIYGRTYHESGMPTGKAEPHVLVVMYNAERDRLAKLAEACAKLGLDERRVKLAEIQVERFFAAVTKAVAKAEMTAVQASLFKQALAEQLRQLPAG